MKEDISNPNIEWKKNNSDPSERLTLRINHKEAAVYSATKKNSFKMSRVPVAENLSKGLRKIRKKIRAIDVPSGYEDEDDDEFQYIPDSLGQLDAANSLINVLNEEEKRLLRQQEELKNMKMQQEAGKTEALAVAADVSRQAGLSGVEKSIAKSRQTNVLPEETAELMVYDVLRNQEKVGGRRIPKGKIVQTLRGAKRIKDIGGYKALQGLSLDMVRKAGEKNVSDKELVEIAAKENNALAKKILEKSGQNVKRHRKKNRKDFSDETENKVKVLFKRNLSLKNLNDRV